MQADHAEQAEAGTGGLRSREPGSPTEDVFSQVGVHLHAGRGTSKVIHDIIFFFCFLIDPYATLGLVT